MNLVIIVYMLVVVCWVSAPVIGSINEPVWTLGQYDLLFDARHAYAMTKDFVTAYPKRVLGSIESRQSTGYLRQQLLDAGYQISYTQFDARIRGRTQVGRNVLGYKPGSSPEIIAVAAHYDTAPTTYEGAMENGSGVGVMLELAFVFSKLNTNRSLLFVATDGTEFGQLGARDIVENYPERGRLVAVLSLDHVSVEELGAFSIDTAGQFGGYAPPWLRDVARSASGMEGLPARSPYGVEEHLQRAVPLSWTDQGPFLHSGIPAVNLGSISAQEEDRLRARAIYHSAEDTIGNLYFDSIARYGRAAERIVRTLVELDSVPSQSMGSFRLRNASYVSAATMSFLHWATFLPLLTLLVVNIAAYHRSITVRQIERELLAYLCTSLPLLLLYYPIGFFRRLRMIPEYPVYPATAKDPVLVNPPWGVVAGILSVGLVLAAGLYFLFRYVRRKLPPPDFHVSRIILMALLLGVAGLAHYYNSYWAATFLFLPAWVWGAVGPPGGIWRRLIHCVLIIGAGIVCYIFVARFAVLLYLGWNVIWYGILALNCGLFSPTAYILAAVTVAVGFRFLSIQFQRASV